MLKCSSKKEDRSINRSEESTDISREEMSSRNINEFSANSTKKPMYEARGRVVLKTKD